MALLSKRPGSPEASRTGTSPEILMKTKRSREPRVQHGSLHPRTLPAGPYRGVPPATRGSPRAPRRRRQPLLWTTGHRGRVPPAVGTRQGGGARPRAGRAPAAREGPRRGAVAGRRRRRHDGGCPRAEPPSPPSAGGGGRIPRRCRRSRRWEA